MEQNYKFEKTKIQKQFQFEKVIKINQRNIISK